MFGRFSFMDYDLVIGYANLGDAFNSPNFKISEARQVIDTLSIMRGNHTIKF